MYSYGLEPIFWLKLVLILAIILVLLVSFNEVMSKWLKVEKKKLFSFFSYNHVNEKHKKVDWTIRITFIVIIILGYFINSMSNPMESNWFFEPWFLLFILIVVSETARAIMEWKYAANRNAYILTISQLVFIIILLTSMFTTNFFGWFG
ncbi:DUF4181 domain-containing protein [Virgibacillus necropolis]|uniref:DUF4181 domain-containing protein n=1 Tax=Virgibacillus necropolis TaxID=163877 RepID=UPI00384B06D0